MDLNSLNSLLGNSSSGSSLIDLSFLVPYFVILTIVSILWFVFYTFGLIRKWRVDSAILESRDILREMNERAKAPDTSPEPPASSSND